MNSTGGPAGSGGLIRWPLARWWVFAALSWSAFAPALGQDNPMPRPPQLERDVQFWIRVYTQIDTNAGLLHDQYNLSVVYDTLHFARSEEHTSELQSRSDLVCRLLLEKKKNEPPPIRLCHYCT